MRTLQGKPVLSAVFRVFGPVLAELPLIATQHDARRQGHCRVFMQSLEALLAEAGVECLSLPAAHSTVRIWPFRASTCNPRNVTGFFCVRPSNLRSVSACRRRIPL